MHGAFQQILQPHHLALAVEPAGFDDVDASFGMTS